MKIVVCGSSFFRKEKVELLERLSQSGHEAIIDPWTIQLAADENPELWKEIQGNHAEAKKKYGFIRWYFDAIRNSDAVLICNYDKNGIEGYIGSNTLMEVAVAYDQNKKIYVLNNFGKDLKCYDEIVGVESIVINGNLEKIK